MENHLISTCKTLLDALNQINSLKCGPLVLFVVDESGKMVGTLTDGDSRRALIAGASVNATTEKIMHRNFNYLPIHARGDAGDSSAEGSANEACPCPRRGYAYCRCHRSAEV